MRHIGTRRSCKRIITALLLVSLLLIATAVSSRVRGWLEPTTHAAATTFMVTNTNDSGVGSLSKAITDANNNPGTDTINFAIGTGLQTINVLSPLPAITDPVIIDGTSQPGFAAAPIIELNGAALGGGASGLLITAGSSTVKGLIINRFNTDGIRLSTGGGNTISGNYIGTNAAGTAAAPNLVYGVEISGSADNMIGGNTAAARNVISGNTQNGVRITSASTGNLVQGNFIGTDATGSVGLGNNASGIAISGSDSNTIGGTAAGDGNLLSGSIGAYGIETNTSSNIQIQGNLIGTNALGTAAVPNDAEGFSYWVVRRSPLAARRWGRATSFPEMVAAVYSSCPT